MTTSAQARPDGDGGRATTRRRSAGTRTRLGIDIGGSGVKGAPVDPRTGHLLQDRQRVPTPHPATPAAVADVVAEVAGAFDVTGPVGCTFPGVVTGGVPRTAAHLDAAWVGTDAHRLLTDRVGRQVTLVNDADAAGMAEMAFGAGRGHKGLVVVVTLGTGVGTALFFHGTLVPNTELGHLEVGGKVADDHVSDATRKAKDLTWKRWSKRLGRYLQQLETVLTPELFIIGGGVSRHAEHFLPHLHLSCEVVPAELHNDAGIVGAALAAARAR